MKIVKLSELTDEKKKKVLQEQENRINTNRQASEQLRINANQQFNEYVNKNGNYDTNKHTTSMNNIVNAYKQTSKTSANSFKKANNISLLGSIKETGNGIGKTAENTWLGLQNGVRSFQQALGRAMTKTQIDRFEPFEELNNKVLNENIKKLVSAENIRKESEETTQEIQTKKDETSNKIQENADSISNTLLKYLAGNIAPTIGQMAPGLVGGPAGAVYFVGSATGNYYDDAKQRGMTDDEATIYSGTMGIIEGSLESIGAKLTTNVGKNLLKKNIRGALINYGLDVSENFLEESIVEPISELMAQITAGKDKANWDNIWGRFFQSGIDGAITSMITGGISGVSGGVASNLRNNKYTDINTGQVLDKNSQNWLKEAESIINESNNVIKLQPNPSQNQNNVMQQQINQVENKIAQNGNIQPISPTQNYVYEKSENSKIDNLRQDASKYWDNSEKTKNYVNMLEKIIQDKDIDIRLNGNLTDSNGNIANGSYSNGVVTINPNSTRAGEFIAVHELTHAIGTEQMKNIVQKYRESNAEFDTAVKSLLQNYDTTELTEEAMADVAGQLFGNQEFINNLAKTEPNIFKKIYNEIKYLWHQFTGYKNQNQFINDLQYKWEQAYRNNNELNQTTNYSIAGRKSLENIRNDKSSYNTGINTYNQAQTMANQNIDNEQIRKQTGWFQDKNGKWKYEISDKNLNIRNNITLKKNGEYSLSQIIEHGTLFKLYPELENIDIKFKDTKGIGGNYKGKSIILSNNLLGNSKKIEKTLVHEIQHAIQDIEGFETGITSKLSKKTYYENLGEIEADDVSRRFVDEKYNNINIKNIAPESSKTNPKHRNYDKYMKNRNSIDKIKDSVFKYSKKGGNSNDINQEYVEQTNGENIQDSNKEIWNRLKNSEKGSFSMQDNQGRTLTKEQQEYFKNSKVRDENGNLLTVYHGTEANAGIPKEYWFTIFDEKKQGNNGSWFGNGFYFTKNKEHAQDYAHSKGNIYESYLNITNPYIPYKNGKSTLSFQEDFRNNFKETEKIEGKLTGKQIQDILKNNGYNGIVIGDNIIAFNSNQIKNIDNTNPTDNPDIRYSLPTKEWQQYLEKNYKSTGTRTNLEDIKLPTKETSNKVSINLPQNAKAKNVKFDNDNLMQKSNKMSNEETAKILTEIKGNTSEKRKLSAFLKANLIDKGMVFEELARKTNNRELQGKWDYTLTAEARGQNAIGNARYDYQAIVENGKIKKGNKDTKQISKSLTDIIDEVGEDPTDFYNYMYHQLNIDRMTLEERFGGDTGTNYERNNPIKNKPVFGKGVTAEISRKYVEQLEQKHPEFKEYAQDVYKYLEANTKELVDNGVISKETQQLFKEMYPHYVPISRVTNKGQAINVPLDTGRTGINSPIKRAKGGNRDIKPLFQTMADRTLQTYRASARNSFGVELKNTLKKAKQLNQITEWTDIDAIMESMTDEEQNNSLLQEGVNGENPTFTVFENGEKVTYEISKDMYDALKPKNELLKRIDNSSLSKGLNKINNFRRGVLTEYNPVFFLTNPIKDMQDVLLNSQHSAKTYAKFPEAYEQIMEKGYWYKEYIQNGGEQNSYFKDGKFENDTKLPTSKKVLTMPLRAISNINGVIEMAPRLAEYIASREAGRSIETSMLDASRVTTNFKAGGDITKTLNRNGFTFLNASVQGMQQQIRNIQEANAKGLKGWTVLVCKYAIAGLPTILLNNLLWEDDEDYEELQDYVKDNYYCLGKYGDGQFIRIPKGRAVATIQKIISNAKKYITEDKKINIDNLSKDFWEDLKFTVDNLAPNNPIDNNIISPIIQAITNKSWYGEDIVPSRLQNKPKAEQYDETTDAFSKWLGEKLNISPYKINYVLDQYGGGAGDVLLPAMTPQAENNVFEDKFTTDSVMKSKYPGEFYTKVDELEVNKNSSKATDEDILKYKYISSISSEIGELYTKKRDIQNSSVTDEKKKKQLKEVQSQINDLAKNGLENIEDLTKGSHYAKIGNKQYYKNADNEWKEISGEDIKINKETGITLQDYSSYQYKVSKEKNKKIANGELEKNQSLKTNDKIQILLDSNYADKSKMAIYENYIKSKTKEGDFDEFKVIKSSNININEYLKYKQQEFESDKNDDGTLGGKTVSGSKKNKVISYLNSMKITGNQRLLLYAINGYSTSASQKAQIVKYVNSLDLKSKEKLKLYDKLSGFTVYKNGKVYYK